LLCALMFVELHLYFPISVPVLATLLTYNGVALYEYGRARTALARFVGRDVATAMLNPLHGLTLGGQTENATAFFCDLRLFSTAAERLSPDAIEPLVNAYTNRVSEIASRFGGRVIDYFGDGVFVVFRHASSGPNHALRAVRAALEVQQETRPQLVEWGRRIAVPLEIGIGINSGEMLIGVVGSEKHMKIGAVGDAVNVASRVQSLTTHCGFSILVTKESHDLIEGIPLTPCGEFEVKGREQRVEVFGAGEPIARATHRDDALLLEPLGEPLDGHAVTKTSIT